MKLIYALLAFALIATGCTKKETNVPAETAPAAAPSEPVEAPTEPAAADTNTTPSTLGQ